MELYGPVNKLLCLNYDRGMVMFLACIKVSAACNLALQPELVQRWQLMAVGLSAYTRCALCVSVRHESMLAAASAATTWNGQRALGALGI